MKLKTNLARDFPKIGGVKGPFETFLKIHPFWWRHPSLTKQVRYSFACQKKTIAIALPIFSSKIDHRPRLFRMDVSATSTRMSKLTTSMDNKPLLGVDNLDKLDNLDKATIRS